MVQHKIEVVDGHCKTLTYSYRYQLDDNAKSWVCRWEYFRQPPKPDYPYPLGHCHVNGTLAGGETVAGKHLPTRRLPLEQVLLHLIEEWDVKPLDEDWRAILTESIEGFDVRKTAT